MRLEGWEQRLAAVIEHARSRPYVLGEHDCFRVACMAVEALTGADRWPEFAGYRTKREALALIARHGSTFEDAFDWFFGGAREAPARARRGDICAIQTPDGDKHLGICIGRDTAFLSDAGLLFVATLGCLCCWRVG